jgi:hypothetical protein
MHYQNYVLAFSAVVLDFVESVAVNISISVEQKAITPTKSGQIGINPITDFGDLTQY